MSAKQILSDKQIMVLSVEKLKEKGITLQEFIALYDRGIFPGMDVYEIRDRNTVLTELEEYTKNAS